MGDNQAWVDFVYSKSSLSSFQPSDISSDLSGGIFGTGGSSPFVFGNKVKLQGVHLNEGYLQTFPDQDVRAVNPIGHLQSSVNIFTNLPLGR